MIDHMPRRIRGHITLVQGSDILYRGPNTIVDGMYEALLRSMAGTDKLRAIGIYNVTTPITEKTRTLGAALGLGAITPAAVTVETDDAGRAVIGTWAATITPTSTFAYRTLGLISNVGALVAAHDVGPHTATNGVAIDILWTLTFGA